MTERITVNSANAKFVAIRRNSVVAILPSGRLDELAAALATAGVDLSHVQALSGPEGASLLDAEGTEHGLWGRIVRHLQGGGAGQNERLNYAEALRAGKDVVAVACADRDAAIGSARVLSGLGGDRIVYFGSHAVEQLS